MTASSPRNACPDGSPISTNGWDIAHYQGAVRLRLRIPRTNFTEVSIERTPPAGKDHEVKSERIDLLEVAGGRDFYLVLTAECDDSEAFTQMLEDIAKRMKSPEPEDIIDPG